MYWWILGAILAFFVLRFLWKSYNHPSLVLGRQAANMNWVASGREKDIDGYKNVKVSRDGMEAVISFRNGNVILARPWHPTPFKDFIEIEKWLAINNKPVTDEKEASYYEAINTYITLMGFYEPLLELQGTDKEYCIVSMKMHKAGYLADQSEKVVGALTIDSVKQYQQNRELAILFLESIEKQFLNKQNEKLKQHTSTSHRSRKQRGVGERNVGYPSKRPAMTPSTEAAILRIVDEMRKKGQSVPISVAEIPGFPFPTFSSLQAAIRDRRFLLQRFSVHFEANIFSLFASSMQKAANRLYMAGLFVLPIGSVVLAFIYSWWWLLGVLSLFFVLGRSKRLYNRVIYSAAFESELQFCFLYFIRQVCVTSADFEESFYWQRDK